MPIYEYKCAGCGQVFELRRNFSDPPLTEHPGCGGSVEKILSAPALQFKGSGFYITDYARSGGRGGSDSKGEKSESKSDSKADSKSESKGKSESGSSSESPKATSTTPAASDSSKK